MNASSSPSLNLILVAPGPGVHSSSDTSAGTRSGEFLSHPIRVLFFL
jgi:hypothetical protein